MKNNILYFFAFLLPLNFLVAQEKVFETSKVFRKPGDLKNDTYALPNSNNDNVMLILKEPSFIKAILLDKNYEEILRLSTKSIGSKFQLLLGYEISNGIYSLLFSNKLHTKICALRINTNSKLTTTVKIDLKLNRERFLESFVFNNRTYIFTTRKGTSNLSVYTLDKNLKPVKSEVDLEKIEVSLNKTRKPTDLYYYFMNSEGSIPYVDIAKIESKNPNVLESTSKSIKFYHYENKVYLTFDQDIEDTKIAEIDLVSFKTSFKNIKKPVSSIKEFKKSNSYLFDEKLFQIASSNQNMIFQITDLRTDELINKFEVVNNATIPFKNSSIIQEKKGKNIFRISVNKEKEIEQTSQYLKKINDGDLGISVYLVNGLYNVVLGATKEAGKKTMLAINVATAIATAGTVAIGSGGVYNIPERENFDNTNPTYYGYYSYEVTKSIYINCLFNRNLDHIEGDIPLNNYDLLNEFEDTLEKPKAVNIFMHKDKLHYNYVDQKTEEFKLFKFE